MTVDWKWWAAAALAIVLAGCSFLLSGPVVGYILLGVGVLLLAVRAVTALVSQRRRRARVARERVTHLRLERSGVIERIERLQAGLETNHNSIDSAVIHPDSPLGLIARGTLKIIEAQTATLKKRLQDIDDELAGTKKS